jgi:hypothetical protein
MLIDNDLRMSYKNNIHEFKNNLGKKLNKTPSH